MYVRYFIERKECFLLVRGPTIFSLDTIVRYRV